MEYKKCLIETDHNGIRLKGRIEYSSKDYSVYLDEPLKAACYGGHLLLMAPVRYVTNLDYPIGTPKGINIESKAQKTLVHLYEKYKDIPYDRYEEEFFQKYRTELLTLAEPLKSFLLERKQLRAKLKAEEITQKEYQGLTTGKRELIKSDVERTITSFISVKEPKFDADNFEKLFQIIRSMIG